MTEQYTYTQPSGIDFGRLTNEIRQEPLITVGLEFINYTNPTVDVFMSGVLTGAEVTALGNVVSGHVANPLPAKPQQFFSDLIPSGHQMFQIGQRDRRWDSLFATSGNFNTTGFGAHDSNTLKVVHPSGATEDGVRIIDKGSSAPTLTVVSEEGGNGPVIRVLQRTPDHGINIVQENQGAPLRINNFAAYRGDIRLTQHTENPSNTTNGEIWYRDTDGNGQLATLAVDTPSGICDVRLGEGICSLHVDEAQDLVSFTTTLTPARLSAQTHRDNKFYSLSNSNERIHVWVNGLYKITYTAVSRQTSSNNRCTVLAGIQKNGGTGTRLFSRSYAYVRNQTDDLGSSSKEFYWKLDAGEYLELLFDRITGGGTMQIADGTNITIELVRYEP